MLTVNTEQCFSNLFLTKKKKCSNTIITCIEKKNQLDVAVCFVAFMIRSTCFGHFYAHHQEI